MIGIFRCSATIHRPPKRAKLGILFGVVSKNLKTGVTVLNDSKNKIIGFVKGIEL